MIVFVGCVKRTTTGGKPMVIHGAFHAPYTIQRTRSVRAVCSQAELGNKVTNRKRPLPRDRSRGAFHDIQSIIPNP